jgi:rhodanese-related sulfurtransferase
MKKFLIILLIVSCGQEIPVVETVEKETFKTLMQNEYPLIDVRTPQEYAEGHIEKASNIDFNASDFNERISKLDKEQPFLIYCAAGGRSTKAAALMQSLGFKKVYELKGGYRNW